MSKINNKFITMCYENFACPDMKEFVFSCKGRPFAMMSSQRIPVPTLSLIDFKLVQDLGLKLQDIQCSKFSYAGSNLRVLGKIKQTVQCVKNGKLGANIHIKANVVEDLKQTFDTHSIAGVKLTKFLSSVADELQEESKEQKPPSSSSNLVVRTPPPPSTSPRNPSSSSPRPSPAASTPSSGGLSSPLRSPPGFPVPQYRFTNPGLRINHDEPRAPLNKPPLGTVRRLQLKPEDNWRRTWQHGRVMKILRPGLAEVDVLKLSSHPLMADSISSEDCHYPGLEVAVNDVVLFHAYDHTPGLPREEALPRICVVYNDEEVGLLKSHGVNLPECPPERLPRGYYG